MMKRRRNRKKVKREGKEDNTGGREKRGSLAKEAAVGSNGVEL